MTDVIALRQQLARVRVRQAELAQEAVELERRIEEASFSSSSSSSSSSSFSSSSSRPLNVIEYKYKDRTVFSNAQPPSSAEEADEDDEDEEDDEDASEEAVGGGREFEDSGEESEDLESPENVRITRELLSRRVERKSPEKSPESSMRF